MKKVLIVIIVCIFSIMSLVGCANAEGSGSLKSDSSPDLSVAIFRGIIDEIEENSAIVLPNADQKDILSSGDKVRVNLSVSSESFEIGDEIIVYYTGGIMESYPLQVDVTDIRFASEFDSENLGEPENSESSSGEIKPEN